MATRTPWGDSQESVKVAPGIMWYSTAGHDGYHLSKKRLEKMPRKFRDFRPFAGDGWYEEDVDWCIVVFSFSKDFLRYWGFHHYVDMLKIAKSTQYIYKEYFSKRGVIYE